jgi:DNA replication and repair protein RecF
MYLKHLSLTNFRNYITLELELPPGIILIQGDNAQGKTNLLEAIYYLATGRSPHAHSDMELIRWDALFSRLVANIQRERRAFLRRIEIALIKEQIPGEEGHRLYKHIRIEGVKRRVSDLPGQAKVVLFMPQDVDLVAGPPSTRRRYLDNSLCQINFRYPRSLRQYNHVLTQRNNLLRRLREKGGDTDQLLFWDEKLAENGAYIMARRQEMITELDELARPIHFELTGGAIGESLRLVYLPSFKLDASSIEGIARAFLTELRRMREEEIRRGMTLVGPHRDDLSFIVDGVDMRIYGSRGQQRTAVLAVKLAEVKLIEKVSGEQPILLLDEVMAELDETRREYLLRTINDVHQSIITTTHFNDYDADFLAKATLLRVKEGRIERL